MLNNGRLILGSDGNSTRVDFSGTQSLSGTGEVIFAGTNSPNVLEARGGGTAATAATLTIGSGITVHGAQGGSVDGASSFDAVINQGTIVAETGGKTVTLQVDNLTNQGTLSAPAGTLTINSTNWSNPSGTLVVSGTGVLNLDGNFTTAGIGNINRTGGTMNILGTLDNTGATLALNAATGSWQLLTGGTIKGGSITGAGGASLSLPTFNTGTVDGVTLAGDVTMHNGAGLTVRNGLVLNNGRLILGSGGNSTRVEFSGTQSLSGTGEVIFGGTSSNNLLSVRGGGAAATAATLTIGSGITVHGAQGGSVDGVSSFDAVINQGTIVADTGGKTVTLAVNTLTNQGTLSAVNGGVLVIGTSLSVNGQATLASSSLSTVRISGSLLGNTQRSDLYNLPGTLVLNGTGTAVAPQNLEAMSNDLGSGAAASANNFNYGTLSVGAGNYVTLVDQSDNSAGVGAEAVYAGRLIVPSGSTLNLNGLHLYTQTAQISGTVVGGTVALLPASPLTVTTTSDVVSGSDGVVSLREAMLFANQNPGVDAITFNIPGTGVQRIALTSALPAITEAVLIDGYSQPGANANSNGPGLGFNTVLQIELNGDNAGDVSALSITSSGSAIRGLIINGFDSRLSTTSGAGITLTGPGATNNLIEGNFIGTNAAGTSALSNEVGIHIGAGASNNTLRGNLISGNIEDGIRILGDVNTASDGNVVTGNLIGTDRTGLIALGNKTDGIEIFNNANRNVVGGPTAADRNVISGNASDGLDLFGTTGVPVNDNLIQGNYIGVDVRGIAALGNGSDGVDLFENATGNRLLGNVFSGNGGDGLDLFNASQTIVQGNFFGTNAAGTAAVRNVGDGMALFGVALQTTIGGNAAGEGNLFSGNGGRGLNISGTGVDDVAITGNTFGLDAFGTSGISNGKEGIGVINGPGNISIGGTLAGEGNSIAFNSGAGIVVEGTSGVSIRGNSIFSNSGLGIDLGGDGVTPNDALDADVGANGLQNFPVLASVTTGAGGTSISGSFNGTPNASFTIDFYAGFAADPSGFGEGEIYLGSIGVTTDASGNAAGNFSTNVPLPAGTQITATATDAAGNTSEFSAALLIPGTSTNYVWDAGGGTDTNWFNALNWAPDGVPGVLDSAVLDGNATITLESPAFIGTFTQSDGVLTGDGTLRVNGFTWSGGTEDGAGQTIIGAGGFLSIEGAALKILSQRTLENGGAGVWSGTGDVQLSLGGIFKNSGSFEIRNDANLDGIADNVQPRFINKGTLEKTGGSGVTVFQMWTWKTAGPFGSVRGRCY